MSYTYTVLSIASTLTHTSYKKSKFSDDHHTCNLVNISRTHNPHPKGPLTQCSRDPSCPLEVHLVCASFCPRARRWRPTMRSSWEHAQIFSSARRLHSNEKISNIYKLDLRGLYCSNCMLSVLWEFSVAHFGFMYGVEFCVCHKKDKKFKLYRYHFKK